ncbi:MAG: hypothetical protein NTY08_08710 [Proteobacteria bacterium]|nr:hypothetical protein [Pseudomonadota bacterium]
MEQLPNWAHAQDMRALLENVENQEFKALSVGLGLGSVQRPSRKGSNATAARSRADTLTTAPLKSAPSKALPTKALPHKTFPTKAAQMMAPRVSSMQRQALGTTAKTPEDNTNLTRRLLAWALDFLLVVATLTLAVAAMTAFSASRGVSAAWVEQRPVQWLVQTSPLATLSLVYGVFLVYGLLFKLLVGRTCGETLLGVSHNRMKNATRV